MKSKLNQFLLQNHPPHNRVSTVGSEPPIEDELSPLNNYKNPIKINAKETYAMMSKVQMGNEVSPSLFKRSDVSDTPNLLGFSDTHKQLNFDCYLDDPDDEDIVIDLAKEFYDDEETDSKKSIFFPNRKDENCSFVSSLPMSMMRSGQTSAKSAPYLIKPKQTFQSKNQSFNGKKQINSLVISHEQQQMTLLK